MPQPMQRIDRLKTSDVTELFACYRVLLRCTCFGIGRETSSVVVRNRDCLKMARFGHPTNCMISAVHLYIQCTHVSMSQEMSSLQCSVFDPVWDLADIQLVNRSDNPL